jgi:Zn-dependent M28 family amino/carboxypeptidase
VRAVSEFYDAFQTQNIIGYVKGKVQPDTFLVFTAHYDHLGQMGPEAYFPGGNDNASGTAMLLDLASYFSDKHNRPYYSVVFIAFGGEEAGLLGSFYYVNHPLFPLSQIKFLINIDMVGSGSDGIKVVNGSVFKNDFERMVKLNDKNNYLKKVSPRGAAANSDHFPFYDKGVPSFFIYTLGDECKEYHNIYDTPENVPYTEYDDLFRLLTDFMGSFN